MAALARNTINTQDPIYKIKAILQLAAITTFLLGFGIILAPDLIVKWFDGGSVGSTHFVRFLGAALIGFGVTNWIYGKSENIEAILPAIYGNLTSLWLAIIVDIFGLSLNMLTRASWLILGLHVTFAAAFTYCVVLIKKSNSL